MNTIIITFRLVDDASYDNRYRSLISAIAVLTKQVWDETTSFLLFQSHLTDQQVRAYLYAASGVYQDGRDSITTLNATIHSYASIGMKNERLFNAVTGTAPTYPVVAPALPRYANTLIAPGLRPRTAPASNTLAPGLADILAGLK